MPARFSNLKRALEKLGLTVTPPNGGSHWRAMLNGKTYPIPAHHGDKTEISEKYIRGVCDCFHLKLEDLRKLL
jgi:hypothetical protein